MNPAQTILSRRQRLLRAVGLFGLLFGVYLLTYTGAPVSTDELLMFDGAHSFIHGRSLELAYTSSYRPYSTPPGSGLVLQLDIEPMQSYAAAPLIALAEHLPGIGLMQAAWTLNLFVTALTAVVLFYYGVALGYSDNVALLVALGFGLATYAWPYSKMFFREPLFTLFVLMCAYSLEKWRQGIERRRYTPGWLTWLVVALLCLIAAQLTKSTSLLVVPILVLILIPGSVRRLLNWRGLALLIASIVAVVALLVILHRIAPYSRSDVLTKIQSIDLTYLPVALPAYLVSPGFSVWTFSPLLIAGLGGFVWLLRTGKARQALVPLVLLVLLAVGYSIFQGGNWYGGTGWGPRYLLPAIPFLCMWLLPIAQAMTRRSLKSWMQAVLISLAAVSVSVQTLGLIIPVEQFPTTLFLQGAALHQTIVPWREGVWNLQYTPLVVSVQQIATPPPIAWVVNNSGLVVIPLCVALIAIGAMILIRQFSRKWSAALAGVMLLLGVAIALPIALHTFYHDPRTIGGDPILFRVLDQINAGMRPGDAVLLNDAFYQRFFMNYYKQPEPIYILPDAPGERLGVAAAPEIATDNPEDQAHPYDAILLPRLAEKTSRWWFLTEFGPYSPGRTRPTEHYLVRHYFPLPSEGLVSELTARLLLFTPVDAPPDTIPPWSEHKIDADFGAARLVGIDLPRGDTLTPGSSLPVSLLWRHDPWPAYLPPFDYSINVSLINGAGVAVAQRSGPPLGTFAPMSQWVQGGYYRDNNALELPDDLPVGDYQLWVLVYDWSKNKNLPVRNAPAAQSTDKAVIATIHVLAHNPHS